MPYYEATGDRQIIDRLHKHYLADEPVTYTRKGDKVAAIPSRLIDP